MVIIEGMDNSGKTTLAKQLKETFPTLELEHSPSKESLGTKLHWVARAIRRLDPHVMYDRYAPISERVYGPIVRPLIGDVFGAYSFDLLRLTLRKNPLIIYCRPSDETITAWDERIQLNGVKSHAKELIQRYDWMMQVLREFSAGSGLILDYDYTRDKFAWTEMAAAVSLHLQASELDLYKSMEKERHG